MRFFNYLKQLAALAVVAVAFVACEPDSPTNDTPKEYAFELTSNATMEFTAEGGEGVIEWTLNEVTRYEPVPEPLPTFSTEAEWIALDADNLGAFVVAANEGEAREAVINIEYKEQKESVTVKQAAAAPAPVEATELAAAMRIPSEELGLENNIFALAFADDSESLELGIVLAGEEGVEVLAAGTYNVDNEGLVADECALQIYTDEGLEEYFFEGGEVIVAVDGENYDFDITLTTTEGEEMLFSYSGVVEGMTLPNGEEPGGDEPGDELPFYNFTSAEICWMDAWDDFQIAFTDANGVVLTCDFWRCTEKNFLPEGTYWVGNGDCMVYTDSYSYIDLNDGGDLQDLQGGKVIVAEVDGKYEFTFEGIYYGSLNDMDNLKQFNGKYVGTIAEMILPSEYEEPNIDELEVIELTQASWCKTYGTWGVTDEFEICWYDAEKHSTTLDFIVNPIVAGTYTLDSGFKATYCKYRGNKMSDCTVVVTGSGELTFDVTFVAEVDGVLGRYHFTWTGNPATLAD